MPIANCIITDECEMPVKPFADIWSQHAGVSSEHMTVNFIVSTMQTGNPYKVMANLALPSLWSEDSIKAIQIGLAKALTEYFKISIDDIHVITQIVDSGMVVEKGGVLTW